MVKEPIHFYMQCSITWYVASDKQQTLVDDCGKSEQAGISGYVVL